MYDYEVRSYEGLKQAVQSENLREKFGKEVGAHVLQALSPSTYTRILNTVSDSVDSHDIGDIQKEEAFVFLHAVRGTSKEELLEQCENARLGIRTGAEIDDVSTKVVRKQVI